MDKSVKIENILAQIRQLDYNTRLYLLESVVKLLKKPEQDISPPSSHITQLNGLGSEIWKNVDVDQYVQQQRQWD